MYSDCEFLFSGKRLIDYIKSYRTTQYISSYVSASVPSINPCNCLRINRENEYQVASNISIDKPKSKTTLDHTDEPTELSSATVDGQFITINHQTLPQMTLRRWFSEIIEAIQNLHLENIYCFDLHPNNILLGAKGEILLSYFYKNIQQSSFSGIQIETARLYPSVYIAPERPLNAKSDWWSAGIIFFELFTGHSFQCCHPNGASWYYEIQYPEGMEVDSDLDSLLNGVRNLYSFSLKKTHKLFFILLFYL